MKFQEQINSANICKISKSIDCDRLYLEISDIDIKQAKSVSQNYSNQTARNYAYTNYLCLSIVRKWIKDNLDLEESYQNNLLPRYWECINGVLITLNSKKLVLIPSDTLDIDGFEVMREWVDIPNFAADYYVPVQVDLEEKYIHFWGFISRKELKEKADYDPSYRMYSVDADWMIDDINLLWTACELCGDEKGEIKPLPNLPETEAKALIKTLSQHSPYSPRLEVEFEKWSALLNNEDWLINLYVERLLKSPNRPLLIWLNERFDKQVTTAPEKPTIVHRGVRSTQPKERSLGFRGVELDTPEKINQAIKQLIAESSQKVRGISSNMADEDILRHLLLKGEKKISGEAADIFWAIASRTPPTPTRRVMTIERQLAGHPIILKIASVQTPSQKVVILLRVYSGGEQAYLPTGLSLMPLDANSNPIPQLPEVTSQLFDEFIQRYFSFAVGYGIGCRVALRNESITEHFIV